MVPANQIRYVRARDVVLATADRSDLTFLFDSTYTGPSITEANNNAAASNAMPGFTPEQTSSLQRML